MRIMAHTVIGIMTVSADGFIGQMVGLNSFSHSVLVQPEEWVYCTTFQLYQLCCGSTLKKVG